MKIKFLMSQKKQLSTEYEKILKLYPQNKIYSRMKHYFRPFVMFINDTNFSSNEINTDKFGFRKTHKNNSLLGLEEIKKLYQNCEVFLGSSAVFGSTLPSDIETLSSMISMSNKNNIYCQNFGIRGSTSHQEVLTFLHFKQYLPKIKKLYIMTGINDVLLALSNDSMFYPEFGGIFSEEQRFSLFWQQYTSFANDKWLLGKYNLIDLIDRCAKKFRIFRYILLIFFSWWGSPSKIKKQTKTMLNFTQKINLIKNTVKNDFIILNSLSKNERFKVIFLLHPALGWSKKKMTQEERLVYEYQKKTINNYEKINSKSSYLIQSKFYKKLCKLLKFKYLDINKIFRLKKNQNLTLFSDFCHLTPLANKIIVKKLFENEKNRKNNIIY